MDDRVISLKKIFDVFGVAYTDIEEEELLDKVYNLFQNNIIYEPSIGTEYLYLGLYHARITKNYENVEKNYLKAIEFGNNCAMNNLACYYEKIKRDNIKAEEYYLKAIENNNKYAANNFALYYLNIRHDIVMAEKYFIKAIEQGYCEALCNLIDYFKRQKDVFKCTELYIKYMHLTERKKVIESINQLWNEKLNKNQNMRFMELLLSFDFEPDDDIPTSLNTFINLLHQKIDLIELHFEYSMNGKGYDEAKKDFLKQIME